MLLVSVSSSVESVSLVADGTSAMRGGGTNAPSAVRGPVPRPAVAVDKTTAASPEICTMLCWSKSSEEDMPEKEGKGPKPSDADAPLLTCVVEEGATGAPPVSKKERRTVSRKEMLSPSPTFSSPEPATVARPPEDRGPVAPAKVSVADTFAAKGPRLPTVKDSVNANANTHKRSRRTEDTPNVVQTTLVPSERRILSVYVDIYWFLEEFRIKVCSCE